jgi:hypothetical protein
MAARVWLMIDSAVDCADVIPAGAGHAPASPSETMPELPASPPLPLPPDAATSADPSFGLLVPEDEPLVPEDAPEEPDEPLLPDDPDPEPEPEPEEPLLLVMSLPLLDPPNAWSTWFEELFELQALEATAGPPPTAATTMKVGASLCRFTSGEGCARGVRCATRCCGTGSFQMHLSSLRPLAVAALLFAWTWARPAAADCTTDTDCFGPTCGSQVCQWTVSGHQCVPAGTDPQGYDGWCTADVNCKCAPQGATCNAAVSHCTFTVPQDAATGGVDAGGTSTSTDTGNSASCAMAPAGGAHGGAIVALAMTAAAALFRRRPRCRR